MKAGTALQIIAAFCATAIPSHAQDASHTASDRLSAPQPRRLCSPADGKIAGVYDPASGAFSPIGNEGQAAVTAVHETVTFKPSFMYRSTPRASVNSISCSVSISHNNALNAGATGSYYATTTNPYTTGKTVTRYRWTSSSSPLHRNQSLPTPLPVPPTIHRISGINGR